MQPAPSKKRKKIIKTKRRQKKKFCQRWDSNPRPHTWTRMLELALASKEVILESGALDHSATLTAHLGQRKFTL